MIVTTADACETWYDIGHGRCRSATPGGFRAEFGTQYYLWIWDGVLRVTGPYDPGGSNSRKATPIHETEFPDADWYASHYGRYDPGQRRLSLMIPDRMLRRDPPESLLIALSLRVPDAWEAVVFGDGTGAG